MADNRTSTTTTTTARRGPGMGGGRGRGGRMIIAKPKDFRGTFRKLLRFMRPHWMGMTAIILLAGATTLASSLSPKINEIVRGAQSLLEGGSGVDFGLLARILMLLMAVYVATSLLRYAQNYVMTGVSQRTMYDLRQAVDRKLSRLNTMIPMPMAISSPVSPTMWTPSPIRCSPALFRHSGRHCRWSSPW